MAQPNCILGLAAGYHYGDVRPFLASLDRVGFDGECVLFVSQTTRDLDRIETHGVTLVPFERPAGLDHVSYNAYRYFLYLDYLEANEFNRVFISDVRDVVFQRDPFDGPWVEGLNCTLEDRRMTIGKCPYNSHWIRGHQGREAVASVADGPISCSGTTLGDHGAILRYVKTMTKGLVPFGGGEQMGGYDQGLHNVLLHTGGLGEVALHDNTGPILTLGYTEGEPRLNEDGLVLNEQGEVAHIVHQYDRKSTLFKTIRKRFA